MAVIRSGAASPARSRLGSRLLALLVLLLLIVVAAALVVQSRLDQDGLRLRIERDVLRQTGRQLTLATLHVRLLPVPTVEATGIGLADWPGGARAQMLTASGLSAHLALLPLLSHVVRLESVTLDRPDILLERSADGDANWQLRKPVVPGDVGGPAGGGVRWETEIGSVRLRDATVAWTDHVRGWSGRVDGLRLDGSGLSGDSPAVTLAGQHGGAAFTLDARTGALSRLQRAASGEPWPVRLAASVQVDGREVGTLTVDGTIADPARLRGYGVDVVARVARLDALNRLFPHAALPAVQGLAVRTHVGDAAPADGDDGRPTFDRLEVTSGAFAAGPVLHRAWAQALAVTSLSIVAPDRSRPVAVAVAGRWHDQALTLRGTAGTLAAWQDWSRGASAPVLALDLAAGDATARIDGTVGQAATDLRASAKVPDMRHLLATGPALTGVALSGRVQAKPDAPLVVSDLTLESHEIGLAGSGSWLAAAHPVLTAVLTSTHMDVDALRSGWAGAGPSGGHAEMQPTQGSRGGVPVGADPPATASAQGRVVPFAALRLADLTVSLDAQAIRLGGEQYRGLTTRLSVQDGRLSLSPFSVAGPAGPIAGHLEADAATDRLSLSSHPSMIRAETLAAMLGQTPSLHGVLELVSDVVASGSTVEALAASASGRVGVSLVDGAIENAALSSLVGRSAGVPGRGETGVRCLALPASLSGGVARIAPLALQTSRLEVQGHGTVGLIDGALDLHLTPRLSVGSANASLPIRVGGRLGAPEAALDPSAPGGRFALTIGAGGPAPDICGPALSAARFGEAGPAPGRASMPDRPRKAPKPVDILRGLGLIR